MLKLLLLLLLFPSLFTCSSSFSPSTVPVALTLNDDLLLTTDFDDFEDEKQHDAHPPEREKDDDEEVEDVAREK